MSLVGANQGAGSSTLAGVSIGARSCGRDSAGAGERRARIPKGCTSRWGGGQNLAGLRVCEDCHNPSESDEVFRFFGLDRR